MASLINGLGGDSGFGENSISRNDDGYSSAIDITSIFENGINLFDNTYNYIYVNTNGNITFDSGLYSYTPGTIGAGSSPIFAPFWADVDTRSGAVNASTSTSVNVDYSLNAYRDYLNDDNEYFNSLNNTSVISNYNISSYDLSSVNTFVTSIESVTTLDVLESGAIPNYIAEYYSFLSGVQNSINEQLGDSNYNSAGNSTGSNLVWYDLDEVNKTITVTWDDVGYYSYNIDKTNAFQLQITNVGNNNVDIKFIYEDINWTTGSASGGSYGLGGTVARAGYSAGDSSHYFEIPFSGDQESILNLEDYRVAGQSEAGVWSLSLSDGQVQGIGLEGSDDNISGSDLSDYLDGRSGDDILFAAGGNDTLNGGAGNDNLNGEDGDDTFFTGLGNDEVYGGNGIDTVEYTQTFNSLNFTDLGDYFSIAYDDILESVDSLYDVEFVSFADFNISVDRILELLSLEGQVTRLYNAVLDRNPDNDGLIYWLNDISSNDTVGIQNLSAGFESSEEFEVRFGVETNEEFINLLYNNILGREAEQAGYDYWLEEIAQSGDRTGMIASFSESGEFVGSQADAIDAYLNNVNLSDLDNSSFIA